MSEARGVAHLLMLLANVKACLEELVLECNADRYEPLRQRAQDLLVDARAIAVSLNAGRPPSPS